MWKAYYFLILIIICYNVSAGVILSGTTSYTANRSNTSQETGYVHLTVNQTAPYPNLQAYFPFDVNGQDFTRFNRDGTCTGDGCGYNTVCDGVPGIGSDCTSGTNPFCCEWSQNPAYCPNYGKCLWFPNHVTDNNYLSFSSISLGASATICTWVYQDAQTDIPYITSNPLESTSLSWAAHQMAFNADPVAWLSFAYTLPDNQWRHLCLRLDTANDNATLFVNGANNASINCSYLAPVQGDCENVGCNWVPPDCTDNYGGMCETFNGDQIACEEHLEFCTWNDPTCDGGWSCFTEWMMNGDQWCIDRDPTYCTFVQPDCNMPDDSTITTLGYSGTSNYYLTGAIDEFMAFNALLSSTQIRDVYKNASSRFARNGTLKFNSVNLGTSPFVNISISSCQMLLNSSIQVQVNNGTLANISSTTCNATNYNLSGVGSVTNANVTFYLRAGNNSNPFYSPIMQGNISLNYPTLTTTCDCPLTGNWKIEDGSICYLNTYCNIMGRKLIITSGRLYVQTNLGGKLII